MTIPFPWPPVPSALIWTPTMCACTKHPWKFMPTKDGQDSFIKPKATRPSFEDVYTWICTRTSFVGPPTSTLGERVATAARSDHAVSFVSRMPTHSTNRAPLFMWRGSFNLLPSFIHSTIHISLTLKIFL